MSKLNSIKFPDLVARYYSDNVEVDDTLSVEGAAADAKKTGDEITEVKDALSEFVSTRFEFNVIHGESEEMFTTDVPYDEIYEAYINGKVVQCRFMTEDGTALILFPWYVNEYGMSFQGNHISSNARGVDRYYIDVGNDYVSIDRFTVLNTKNFIGGHQFDEFDPWYEYDVGDYCYFGSTMYKCKLAYHGTGEDEYPPASHFEETNVMAEISAAIADVDTLLGSGVIT